MALTLPYRGLFPSVHSTAFVAPNATLIGDLHIGAHSSIWFGAVLRGDVMAIRVGARTSVQDLSMVHTTSGWAAATIGDDCTIGHSVLLHGCQIADRVLIGMGSILLDEAFVDSDTILGAGSLVPTRTRIPTGVLAFGRPAKVVRELREDELQAIRDSADRYVNYAANYQQPAALETQS